MILKEAFRYSNYLEKLYDRAVYLLSDSNFVTTKTEEHLRNKSYNEAENETIVVPKSIDLDTSVNDVVDFAIFLITEREKLVYAIADAKAKAEINIDSSVQVNRMKQNLAGIMQNMGRRKATEIMTSGRAYKFNADGDQVTYTYDVKQVVTIDFDRNKVKKIAKKLTSEADTASSQVDLGMLTIQVDYEAPFEVNDSLEDALETFVNSR